MVGVAGKSKACGTCRKRRAKCDLSRPECLACLRTGRVCSGYEKRLIYVNRTAQSPTVTATNVLANLHKKQEPPDRQSPRYGAATKLYKMFSDPDCGRHDFRVHATDLLKQYYLPKSKAGTDGTSDQGSFSWVYTLDSMTGPSAALDTSLFALCLTQIYHAGGEDTTLAGCLDWYNDGLQYLRQDLSESQVEVADETLAAIACLTTVELFLVPSDNGWRTHAHGIANIMKQRGTATSGQTPIWKHLLARLRTICTIDALTKRHAQILDGSVWRLRQIGSGSIGPLVELYDLVSDLPDLMEIADGLGREADLDQLLDGTCAVFGRLLSLIQRIDRWLDAWRNKSDRPLYWATPSVVSSPVDPSPSQKVFPFATEFISVSVMAYVVQVWTVKSIIYSDIIQLYEHVRRQCSQTLTLADLMYRTESSKQEAASTLVSLRNGSAEGPHTGSPTIEQVREEGMKIARLICQSLEFAHRKETGNLGVHMTLFPRWAAWHYFRFHAPHGLELQWLNELTKNEGPGTRWNYDMMAFSPLKGPIGFR